MFRRCFVPVAILFVAGCGEPAKLAADRVVTVSVAYSEPPPAGSSIDIRVVEVSGPDRAIAGSLSAPASPGPFEVKCPASRIREAQQYGLEIHVVQNGASLFRNREPYYVLTRGNPDKVSVTLRYSR